MKKYILLLMVVITWSCGASPSKIKVATYNIYWLDENISAVRKEHLQKVIHDLNADIIAFQEIQSLAALKNILPENYDIGMTDDPDELQELALAVRKPFTISNVKMLFPEEVDNLAFPKKRDLLQAWVEGKGQRFTVLVHHAKSRSGGRIETDSRRERAADMIMRYLTSRVKQEQIILLGDFNDNPDDRSLNILEYGDFNAKAGIDDKPDTFLYNTTEPLLAKEYCSYGYNDLYDNLKASTFDPAVKGAREENNKWRGKPHDYMKDVKVKAILFDQILVSQNLKSHVIDTGIFTSADAVTGTRSHIRFQGDDLVYTTRGTFASDHVPVWVVLKF